jgi:hypothetical protein
MHRRRRSDGNRGGAGLSWWRRLWGHKEQPLPELNVERRNQFASAEWLEPWIPIDDVERAAVLKRELVREVSKGHVLEGRDAEFIAQRQDRDDFLVALEQGEIGIVHLTWSIETDPQFPGAALYPSFEEWRTTVMLPDADEWEAMEREYRESHH